MASGSAGDDEDPEPFLSQAAGASKAIPKPVKPATSGPRSAPHILKLFHAGSFAFTPVDVQCRAMQFDNALGEPRLLGLCFLHKGIANQLHMCRIRLRHKKQLWLSSLQQGATHTKSF